MGVSIRRRSRDETRSPTEGVGGSVGAVSKDTKETWEIFVYIIPVVSQSTLPQTYHTFEVFTVITTTTMVMVLLLSETRCGTKGTRLTRESCAVRLSLTKDLLTLYTPIRVYLLGPEF